MTLSEVFFYSAVALAIAVQRLGVQKWIARLLIDRRNAKQISQIDEARTRTGDNGYGEQIVRDLEHTRERDIASMGSKLYLLFILILVALLFIAKKLEG